MQGQADTFWDVVNSLENPENRYKEYNEQRFLSVENECYFGITSSTRLTRFASQVVEEGLDELGAILWISFWT